MQYKQRKQPSLLVEEVGTSALISPGSWVDRIVAGLPIAEFDSLREMLGLSVEDMASKIGISVATLSRRRAQDQPLGRNHSDRLMRYARLYWLCHSFFDGDPEAVRNWLSRPALALNDRTPLGFAETELGAREVEDLIGRLEHGVYI